MKNQATKSKLVIREKFLISNRSPLSSNFSEDSIKVVEASSAEEALKIAQSIWCDREQVNRYWMISAHLMSEFKLTVCTEIKIEGPTPPNKIDSL
jgi:hypothetical protein